ncbi:PucR family transcriptional regulator [Amycolatopsis anabasis]|uniref:PucR family transcriptional regulator n=1 Tax=Amycolatopsis anabasis TaxID=1840409 RepID=UPI00131A7DBF|nr:PucR family transcriptional regulator [Amycolatopsis anabasis]
MNELAYARQGGSSGEGGRADGDADPWAVLPVELAAALRPISSRIAEDIVGEIVRDVPQYARVSRAISKTTRHAVLRCVDAIGGASPFPNDLALIAGKVGRDEFADGRDLDALQTAIRIAGRVAWRHVADTGRTIGLTTETLCLAAEALFAFVDEVSSVIIEAYSDARVSTAGVLERRRRGLLELILAETPSSPHAISALADAARWPVPKQIAVVALAPREGQPEPHVPELDDQVLMDLEGPEPCLLTPYPERHLRGQDAELRGWHAAVGPIVPLKDARTSWRWARRTIEHLKLGTIPDGSITWFRDHLSTLWLLSDDLLVAEAAKRSLGPLDPLPPAQRDRLGETLLAWLQTRGTATEIAARLNLHAQTVRQRMHHLHNLFGEQMEDPERRLEMIIALRARQLRAQAAS